MMLKLFHSDNTEIPDQVLAAKIRDGDRESFRVLFLRYYSHIRSFIFNYTDDMAQADDITQNMFVKVWIQRDKLNPDKSVKNYLYVIARNEAVNELKRKRIIAVSEYPSDIESDSNSSGSIEYSEFESAFKKCIDSMPEQRRRIFLMNRFYGKNSKEIADVLGIAVRTVDKHLELARRQLKDVVKNSE